MTTLQKFGWAGPKQAIENWNWIDPEQTKEFYKVGSFNDYRYSDGERVCFWDIFLKLKMT